MELNKLHHGLDYQTYHDTSIELRALRAGHLGPLKKSPAHLKVDFDKPSETKDYFEFGKAAHLDIESEEKFNDLVKVEPIFEGRTKKGELTTSMNCTEVKEAYDFWHANIPKGVIVVSAEDMVNLKGIRKTRKENKLVSGILREGIGESSLWVKDPETGVNLACRPDHITKSGHVIDFKTTRDATRGFFINQIFSERSHSPFYLLSCAHYAHCLKVAGIGKGDHFVLIAIEKEAPWGIKVYPLDAGHLDAGEVWRSKLTRLYAECLSKDYWPNYADRAEDIDIPQWLNVPEENENGY
jgi:hypothetical protein